MRNDTSKSKLPRSQSRTVILEPLESRQLMSTVVVNTIADSTDPKGSSTVSLRDAIAIANASTTPTSITFIPTVFDTAKTITLTGANLTLSNSSEATTITGPTATLTIDGRNKQNNGTDFQINSGVSVSISHLVVYRGAFTTQGNLTISQVTVSDEVFDSSGYGGGIANISPATLVASDSTIIGNVIASGNGGGLWNSGKATLTDVTVSDNTASNQGAGIYNSGILSITRGTVSANDTVGGNRGGGLYNAGTATLTDVTIANSKAGGGIVNQNGNAVLKDCTIAGNTAVLHGGGIDWEGGSVSLANTIVAGNTAGETGQDVYGTFTSLGHNLIGKTDGSTGWISTDFTGTIAKPLNADLGSLADNGGPTETLLPLTGSPAIDKGSNNLIPSGITTDQRGLPRIVKGMVDIGSVEVQSAVTTTLTVTSPVAQTATVGDSQSFTLGSFTETNATGPYTATVNWGDGTTASTIKLTAPGTIPAAAHTYAATGSKTISVSIADSASHTSNTATFGVTVSAVLATGTISGTVFNDANGDKKLDDGELGLGDYVVFIDVKNTGKFATGDPIATTAANGAWSFTGLAAGTYHISVEPLTGATLTTPQELTLTIKAGGSSLGNFFGEKGA